MGLSAAEIGLLFMIHSLGGAIAYVPAGILADHVANRGILLALTFFWVGGGYLLASFSNDFWTFAVLIAVANAGDSAWHPLATGVLVQMHKARRAYALGMHAVGGHISEVIALPVCGLFLAMWDWRIAIQVLVIPTFLVGCLFLAIRHKVPRRLASRPTRHDAAEIWRTWSSRDGLRVIAILITYNMGLFAIITMTPLFLRINHGYGWIETAMTLAAMMILGALAQPWTGRISDNIGRRPLIILGNGIAAGAAFAAWASSSITLTLIALGLALTVQVSIRAVLLASAVDHAGGREGTSLGLAFAFMDGIAASAAVLAGLVGKNDLANAFLLASGFSLAAVLLALSGPKPMPSMVEKTAA
jgi:predicted MFS family arabinose efflux permease